MSTNDYPFINELPIRPPSYETAWQSINQLNQPMTHPTPDPHASLVQYALAENGEALRHFLEKYGCRPRAPDEAVEASLALFRSQGSPAIECFLREVHPDAPMFAKLHENAPASSPAAGFLSDDFHYTIHVKHVLAGIAIGLLAYLLLK